MVQQEAVWLARELDDHLIASTQELHDRLKMLHPRLIASDANVQMHIESLPERESLALRCMLARDLFHLFALYEKFFKEYDGVREPIPMSAQQQATDRIHAAEPAPAAPRAFQEWLFENQ